jgi:hypothetical protein
MLENLKKGIFPFIIAASALSVSASAAFYSVSGLSKLFAGASLEVIIMAGSLEVSKLVIASLLYQYWNELNKVLRTYLTVATLVLILITSMGIYGFLSAAYQETYSKLSLVENEKSFIQQKVDFYQDDLTRYDEELKQISSNIATLSNAKASSIQIRDTSVAGGVRSTISTTELRLAQARIATEEENRKTVQAKREVVVDSLRKYQQQVLELDNNTEVAGELGPLQYLSGLTGAPMDKIINILLLIIIFVFDPLAIALVVAANFAFEKAYPKKRENLYGELVNDFSEWDNLDNEVELEADPDDLPNIEDEDHALDMVMNDMVKDMEVNDLEEIEPEYNILDLNKDGVIDEDEIQKTHQLINKLQSQLDTGISSWRKGKIQSQINELQSRLNQNEDNTKTY